VWGLFEKIPHAPKNVSEKLFLFAAWGLKKAF
jgi:hypothetical protein